jgi:purine-binding chemotaxis protein CheW
MENILHFRLMNVLVCMDIKYVIKVLPLVRLEKVPLSPMYVAGLMNLAGKSITVMDFAMLLGMKRVKPYTTETPVLLCSDGGVEVAMIVDAVLDLTKVNESTLQVQNELKKPFLGTFKLNDEFSLFIDMKELLKESDKHEQ